MHKRDFFQRGSIKIVKTLLWRKFFRTEHKKFCSSFCSASQQASQSAQQKLSSQMELLLNSADKKSENNFISLFFWKFI